MLLKTPMSFLRRTFVACWMLVMAWNCASIHGRFLSHTAARKTVGPHGILRSIPALNLQGSLLKKSSDVVSTKISATLRFVASPLSSAGTYYGMSPQTVSTNTSKRDTPTKRKRVSDTMMETLDELRRMREEMEAIRKELQDMRQKVVGQDLETGPTSDESRLSLMKRLNRQRMFEKVGGEVEKWAHKLLFDEEVEQHGWKEIECNKMFRGMSLDGRTKVYLKWMKDSRGKFARNDDEREYPCIKMYATIDAPLEDVCLYLSKSEHMDEYNDLLDEHRDLEEISPHAKICLGMTPQILFVKPKEFITYCQHRWLSDGTQVIVNQACDHESVPPGRTMAYAIRGANFIGRHPEDPGKTRICMLAHGNPGDDVPQWAMRTAVNALAPIEPFKLFYKINQGVVKHCEELERTARRIDDMEMVSSLPGGRTRRPAGIAQLGYACFWPNGGGIKEGGVASFTGMLSDDASPNASEQGGSLRDKLLDSSENEIENGENRHEETSEGSPVLEVPDDASQVLVPEA